MRQPSSSNILITLVEGDSRLWPGFEIKEILHNGESTEYENDAGMLEEAIAEGFKPTVPGTYYIYGFRAIYSKDYFGEVDVDYELEGWRKAEESDTKQFFEQEQGHE